MKISEFRKLIREEARKVINEEKTIQTFGPRLIDGLKKNGFESKFTTNDQEASKLENFIKTSDKKLAVIHYSPQTKFIQITTNKNNQAEAFKVVNSPFVKELLPDDFVINQQGSYFIQLQGK